MSKIPAVSRLTVPLISSFKSSRRRISAMTAYDFTMASLVDRAGIDLILVGDSLGCVVKGEENTLNVSMTEMLYHTRCVTRAVQSALVVADMPFLSYQTSSTKAVKNAGMLLQAGAQAVKLEGGIHIAPTIQTLVQFDIPVVGHIGLTPQSYHRMGGHKIQGKSTGSKCVAGTAERIIEDALAVEQAGAFAVVIEGIPAQLAKQITEMLSIPTIGIAAGNECDGQILVSTDYLGLNPDTRPAFVKSGLNLAPDIVQAFSNFHEQVQAVQLECEVSHV
jgi:3-methyl-2-oxobutanoate hydroxymethyltransferase